MQSVTTSVPSAFPGHLETERSCAGLGTQAPPQRLFWLPAYREPMCVCGQICFEYPPYGAKHFLLPLPQQLPWLILMCLHLCLHICSFFLNNVWLIQLSNEKQGLSWDIDRLHICWISNLTSWVWNLSTLRENILGEILMRTGIHHLFMSYFHIFSLCFHPWKFQLKKICIHQNQNQIPALRLGTPS